MDELNKQVWMYVTSMYDKRQQKHSTEDPHIPNPFNHQDDRPKLEASIASTYASNTGYVCGIQIISPGILNNSKRR